MVSRVSLFNHFLLALKIIVLYFTPVTSPFSSSRAESLTLKMDANKL